MLTRKKFILNGLSVSAAAALLGYKVFEDPFGNYLYRPSVSFDLHSHPGKLFATGKSSLTDNAAAVKTISEMNDAHLSGAFFSLVADSKLLEIGPNGITATRAYQPGEAWKEYKDQLKNMKEFLELASVPVSTDANDLKRSKSVTAYIAVEGGDFLEGSTEKLNEAYAEGIRSIQLVHYAQNDLGDLQTNNAVHNGLSQFGKNVVKKMNKLGMLIDAAHAAYQTTKDIAGLSESPIMLSHSILEMEANRPVARRAISKEHAKVVAQTGGLIGAWPSGFNKSFDEFVENTLRLVETVGIDHVGIGTDMDGNFKPVLSSYTQYPLFTDALKSKGLSQNEIEKIMGGNALTILNKVINHPKKSSVH